MNSNLTPDQKNAYDLVDNGKNVFITGSAGCGKSYLIDLIATTLSRSKIVSKTSTTGISALAIGGRTIHSFSGCGIFQGDILSRVRRTQSAVQRWKTVQLLIIDEVSMLSARQFDILNSVAKTIRKSRLPFGGIQLVLTGDFKQLPPVFKSSEDVADSQQCFESKSWSECVNEVCTLTTNMRQGDCEFAQVLNSIRLGDITPQIKSYISKRIGLQPTDNNFIVLHSHNANIDTINNSELTKLKTILKNDTNYIKSYDMTVAIIDPKSGLKEDTLITSCIAPQHLTLAVGCKVMLVVNQSVDAGLVNGSLGLVESFTKGGIPMIRFKHKNQLVVIDKHTWNIEDNNKVIATLSQLPLKLAYAATIHKCQGMTVDAAVMDLSRVFLKEQVYVALSRVRTITGLYLKGISWNIFNKKK
jgi:ATP-dependent exoDNAse (exonuclease V) alpha subunit